jgi:hypothetical protein
MAPRDPQAPEHAFTVGETPTPPAQPEIVDGVVERVLPSGRKLVLRIGSAGEDIEIRSAGGDLDLRITLTDAGPVVSLRGARIEVDTADVAVRCRDFDVQASGTVRLASEREVRFEGDELRAETKRDIHLNGTFIRLNCTADGDAEAQALLAQMAAQQAAQAAAGDDPCGGHDASHAAGAASGPKPPPGAP